MRGSGGRQSGNRLKCYGVLAVGLMVAGFVLLLPCVGFADQGHRPAVIVIDPGHGGHDHGARGSGGSLEKEAALNFARRLSKALSPEYPVVLTRTGDYQVDLLERAAAANYHQARIFISVHIGGGFRSGTNGWSVFYCKKEAEGSSLPEAEPVRPADRERAAGIPWDQVQRAHERESRNLAECIRFQLADLPQISEVAVTGAALRVLQGIDCPAVAIEAGYLTHPQTEKLLADAAFLTEAARRIKKGIDTYLSR